MFVLDNEHIMMVDCDDTLVMWTDNHNQPGEGKVELSEPYTGSKLYLVPHQKHISLVKAHKARGYSVVVWSAAGYQWAKEVVRVLELENYVDIVMTKPSKFVDDLQANEILGTRVYLK